MKNKPYINYSHVFSKMLAELKERMKEIGLTEYELHSEVDYFPPQITEEMLDNKQDTIDDVEIFRVNVKVRYVKVGKYSITCYLQDDGSSPYWCFNVMQHDTTKECRKFIYKITETLFYESQWENLKELINSIDIPE